jgi:Protein of unknown function (DUF1761)
MNFTVIALAALIPMAIGFVWYNPKVLGKAWMESAGMTEESMKGANMALIFGLSFLFAMMLSLSLTTSGIIIHQSGINSIFAELKSPEQQAYLADFMAKYGTEYRTFKHGVLHGVIAGLLLALPFIGTNALFERKGFKYIAINVGYWIITLALMGGVISQFA